jgi:hypothetical protein
MVFRAIATHAIINKPIMMMAFISTDTAFAVILWRLVDLIDLLSHKMPHVRNIFLYFYLITEPCGLAFSVIARHLCC